MAWTIYRLSDGEMICDGWPGDDHPSETGFAFDGTTMGAVEGASTQRALQAWDKTALKWEYSPQIARDRQWEAAKAYGEAVAASGFVLPGVGAVQTDMKSREAIRTLVDEARDRIDEGEADWSTAFVNEANDAVPVTAQQILAIYRAVRAFLGACYAAQQAARDALDAALERAASADEINAIDITAGYPANEGAE